jgi:hypothetical protein
LGLGGDEFGDAWFFVFGTELGELEDEADCEGIGKMSKRRNVETPVVERVSWPSDTAAKWEDDCTSPL